MDGSAISSIILGAFGFGLTAYYSWHSKKIAHEQMQKELFAEFNHRYDGLNNYLVKIQRECPDMESFEKHEEHDLLKQKVIDYFSLCAEEFYWYHHKGRIDTIVWNSWQAGMKYWYDHVPVIKALWLEESKGNGKQSYYITNDNEVFF